MRNTNPPKDVYHVTRAFSAEPTLSITLGNNMRVHEMPLPEAMASQAEPDLLWMADAEPNDVRDIRRHFPTSSLLVTTSEKNNFRTVDLLESGADLVLQDPSVVCAAAGLQALARRPRK